MICRTLTSIFFLITCAVAQSTAQKYDSIFENDVVAVYGLDLSPGASTSIVQSSHDSFWLALNDANVTFSAQQGNSSAQLRAGDVRFFPSFDSKLIANSGADVFRGIVVVLKPRALISNGCECTGNTGKAICGCKDAGHLESLWAFNMGSVTLAGTQLAPGERFRAAAQRDDMLLVAISDIDLEDDATSPADSVNGTIHLKSGNASWIKGGSHRFKNIGSIAARFVTFEF